MNTLQRARIVVALGLWLGCGGCLLSPYDLESFDHQSAIPVSGATQTAGGTVQIQACLHPNFFTYTSATHWDTIATVKTGNSAAYVDHYDGDTYLWYTWDSTIAIPSEYWSAPTSSLPPPSATIRIIDPSVGDQFIHYANDPNECPLPWGMAQVDSTNPKCGRPTAPNTGIVIFANP
jgi:hypothetical protein